MQESQEVSPFPTDDFKAARSIWCFYGWKEAAQAHLSLHLSKCHIVGNHMSQLKFIQQDMD